MSAEDTELFEATSVTFDDDAAEGVEEGCVVGAEVDAGSDGSGVPFTFAAAEEDVGRTEDGLGREEEEGGPQV
jgi:hypothetical protein